MMMIRARGGGVRVDAIHDKRGYQRIRNESQSAWLRTARDDPAGRRKAELRSALMKLPSGIFCPNDMMVPGCHGLPVRGLERRSPLSLAFRGARTIRQYTPDWRKSDAWRKVKCTTTEHVAVSALDARKPVVVEVEHRGFAPDGELRHPVIRGWEMG